MENCSCSCDIGTEPDVIGFKEVKARKSHKCCECGSEIEKGEKYEIVSGLWDDSWNSFKTCILCARIREDLCDCAPFGYLQDEIENCYGFDYLADVEKIDE